MFDWTMATVSSYNGRGGKEKAVEVFNCATGETVWTSRRRPFENKDAWVARAFEDAKACNPKAFAA